MANLSIRKLDESAHEQLRIRAAKHGISMEEEARQIIYQVVSEPEQLGLVFQKYFGRENGIDLNILDHHEPHEPISFNDGDGDLVK